MSIEQPLTALCRETFDQPDGQIRDLVRIADGWECDVWSFVFLPKPRGHVRLPVILRMYRGEGAAEKQSTEVAALCALKVAGYPVPVVFADGSQLRLCEQPFVLMEKITGETLGAQMRQAGIHEQDKLIESFSALFRDLHQLDVTGEAMRQIPEMPAENWLERAGKAIQSHDLPQFKPVLVWMESHRPKTTPPMSLVHGDFHPWNILVDSCGRRVVIDWTSAHRSDFRFDLAWTLLLAASTAGEEMRLRVLSSYERQAGSTVSDLDFFEVAACARRLADIFVSLRDGPERMGMRPEAADLMIGQRSHVVTAQRMLEQRIGLRIVGLDHFFA